jgi:RND family efflux transporter MFP subunit
MELSRGVFFLVVISAFFLPACGKIGQKKTIPGPNDKVYTVSVAGVTERDVPDVIKLDGRFIPFNSLQIKSDFTGKVQALSVQEGQGVTAGEVLLKIEDERLPFVLEQQRAALREAEAQLELDRSRGFAGGPEEAEETPAEQEEQEQPPEQQDETGASPFEGTPPQEEQNPEEAQQEQAQDETGEQPEEPAPGEDESPMSRLARLRQRAQQARAAAQARLRNQQQAREPAPQVSGEEVKNREALDQAKIDRLQAELALTEKQMEGSTLTATFEGMVTKVEVSEGSLVKPGDVLLEIFGLDPLELSLKIPKEDIAQIDKRMAVKVTVPDLGNRSFPGEISFIGAALEQDQQTVEVRVRVTNLEQKIKIGMEGIAEIALEKASHRALLVPEAALVRREGKNFIYLVDGQVARASEVETGASVEGWVEIRKGLRAKDQVVTQGVEQLKGPEEFIKAGA